MGWKGGVLALVDGAGVFAAEEGGAPDVDVDEADIELELCDECACEPKKKTEGFIEMSACKRLTH